MEGTFIMFNKSLKYLLIIFTAVSLSLIAGSGFAQGSKPVIILDPAHGGDDAGVVGVDDVQEKQITLAIALAIKKELAVERNMDVILTRESDKTVTLDERKKIISSVRPALVLSLHVNAGFGKSASGFELYYPGFKNADPERKNKKDKKEKLGNNYLNDTVKLSRLVQKNLDTLFPRKGRGLREAPIPLMEGVHAPVLIVELGFATSAEEKKKLASEKTQTAIAKAIAKSIKGFF